MTSRFADEIDESLRGTADPDGPVARAIVLDRLGWLWPLLWLVFEAILKPTCKGPCAPDGTGRRVEERQATVKTMGFEALGTSMALLLVGTIRGWLGEFPHFATISRQWTTAARPRFEDPRISILGVEHVIELSTPSLRLRMKHAETQQNNNH